MARFLPLCAGAWLVGSLVSPALAGEAPPAPAQVEFFEKSVRPLLSTSCFSCHGSDKQKGGLRLDSRAALFSGGDSGPAVVVGKPEESRLITAVHYDNRLRMPPRGKLHEEEIRILTDWIKQGAPWPETDAQVRPVTSGPTMKITAEDRAFWSFQPLAVKAPPAVRDTAWAQTAIDRFVQARREAAGLHSVGQADKRTLLRRATFDLTGLPPTPEEIQAFLNDDRPDAFARVVDRLLNSPHYGERWARHWLDIARYGEDQAHTFQARLYPNGFRYRDWLIQAFNADLPYDRFIKEQLAADLMGDPEVDQRLAALGFFAVGPVYYGDRQKFDQYDDRIDTLTRGVLGLTVACARCHDHKFDPIPTRDYYALASVFANTDYVEVPLVPPEVVEAENKKLTDVEKKKKVPPKYPFVHALKEAANPIAMKVRVRGNVDNVGEEVAAHFLTILDAEGKPFGKGSGRLQLAEAIASPDNPLTARVLVNRIWQHHFGRGIVGTASNFGKLGERPTHPELLDYLAARFLASGWSIKAIHREIMLSAVYQQSSHLDAHDAEVDPENRLLWRMNRRRLEVEAWRDALLAASGNLDAKVGGPSFDLTTPDARRRTCYAAVSRHELNPLLRLFDFPDPNITAGARTVTTVPLQQLFVLNSEFMVRNAKALVARLDAANRDEASAISQAYLLLYGRPVTARELELGLAFLNSTETAEAGLSRWEQYAQVLLSANEFLYLD